MALRTLQIQTENFVEFEDKFECVSARVGTNHIATAIAEPGENPGSMVLRIRVSKVLESDG